MSKKILIADGSATERLALRAILSAEPSWEIIEINNGQTALDRLCDGLQPDLCVFDLRMPQLDGLQLLQRMRRDPLLRELKVVIASSTRDKDTIVALAKLQIAGYLLKPYAEEKTLKLVRPLLASNEADPLLRSKNLLAKTLLLVDDDATHRMALLETVKTEPGWEIVVAKGGREALDRLHAGLRPDLAMIDLRMPDLDGLALLTKIREDSELKKLKVIVISSEQDRDRLRELAKLNISGYLLKPFDAAKVRACLNQAAAPVETPEAAVTAATEKPIAPSTS